MAFKFPIEQAPRDGTVVEVMADGFGPYRMYWDPNATNPIVPGAMGLWVSADQAAFTWDESRGAGPTHYRKLRDN